jgi:hypothetical protein
LIPLFKLSLMKYFAIFIGFCSIIWIYSCSKDKGLLPQQISLTKCDSLSVTYSLTIAPIIAAKCAIPGCHVPTGGNNIPYTTYAEFKAKVGPDNNPLYNRLFVVGDMPKTGSLTDEEKDEIKCWINAGAPDN